jgi:hypothetical protein
VKYQHHITSTLLGNNQVAGLPSKCNVHCRPSLQ